MTPLDEARLRVITSNFYDVEPSIAIAYMNKVTEHIQFVIEAGRVLGVPDAQILYHDYSKFGAAEFGAYARHFYGGGNPREFAYAYLHHLHHNPHHWEHWCFASNYGKGEDEGMTSGVENGALEMPLLYVKEMLADWIGASLAYTGSDDMTKWLNENVAKIRLHPKTAEVVSGLLNDMGYGVEPANWSELPKPKGIGLPGQRV